MKTEGSSRLSRERQIISVKKLKRLVKKKTPVFLAVIWGQENRKVNAAVKSESIRLTEGKKRDLMKKLGPKKRFLSVEEREEEILSRVDPDVCGKLKELVDEFKDVFPDTLPKGRPPKRDIVHEICTEQGAKPPSWPPCRLGPRDGRGIPKCSLCPSVVFLCRRVRPSISVFFWGVASTYVRHTDS